MNGRPLVSEDKKEFEKLKRESANDLSVKLNNNYEEQVSKANGAVGSKIGGVITKKAVEDFEKKLIDK